MIINLDMSFDNKNFFDLIKIPLLLILITTFLFKYFIKKYKSKSLFAKGKIFIEKRNKNMVDFIEKHKNELSKDRQSLIINLSASQLVEKIKSCEITAKEAFLAYAFNIATIGKDLNLIADVNFDLSFEYAIKADETIKNTKDKNSLPKLIGLPFSIKEHIYIEGFRSTQGLLKFCDNVVKENSYICEILFKEGAVPLCKSNIPQGMIAFESLNNLYGNALNPWNINKSTGGSSGGEGGLIASFSSPIGIGTDIGGSIRAPSMNNGIFGFKPTINRLSKKGILQINKKTVIGFNAVDYSVGPMGRNVDDLVLFCKTLFGTFINDFNTNNAKFNEGKYEEYASKKNLRIGFDYSSIRCPVAEGIKESIDIVLDKLKSQGHQVIQFPIDKYCKIVDKGVELLFNSGRMDILLNSLEGEDEIYVYKNPKLLKNIPGALINPIIYLLEFMNKKRKATVFKNFKEYQSLTELYKSIEDLNEMKEEFYKDFIKNSFDCIIVPVQPIPALDNGIADLIYILLFYTMIFNILDMPAGSIPIGNLNNLTYNCIYNDEFTEKIKKTLSTSLGLPIGLQVVCLPGNDEKCLGIMKNVSNITGYQVKEIKIKNK